MILLSVLIPTLTSRRPLLERLLSCLKPQITDEVEVIIESDNGEATIGTKRNWLVGKARGKYLVFIDDDDLVSEIYLPKVLEALRADPDAVGYWIQRYQDGAEADKAIHTLRNSRYAQTQFQGKTLYQRHINHVNPIRTSIAKKHPFKCASFGEDTDFAVRIKGDLKSEVFIDEIMYHYLCRTQKTEGTKLAEPAAEPTQKRHNILLKYASRSRPHLFTKRIEEWTSKAAHSERLHWLASFDEDDETMNNDVIKAFCEKNHIEFYLAPGINKIDAINRDVEKTTFPWDVLISVADDYECSKGWDDRIDSDLPSTDLALWYPDNRQHPVKLCTLPILGRKAYEEVLNSHIYDPRFKSVFCDDLQQNLLQKAGRLKYIDHEGVFLHKWRVENSDALMNRNESKEVWKHDEDLYRSLGGLKVPLS